MSAFDPAWALLKDDMAERLQGIREMQARDRKNVCSKPGCNVLDYHTRMFGPGVPCHDCYRRDEQTRRRLGLM